MANILVVTEHIKGNFEDISFEMLGLARELAGATGGTCSALVFGAMKSNASQLGAADVVLAADAGDEYNPEEYSAIVESVIKDKSPDVVLIGSTSMGVDIAGQVGTTLNLPIISYCNAIEASGSAFKCTSQLYGGKLNSQVQVSQQAIVMVLAGSADPETGKSGGSASVEDVSAGKGAGKVRFKTLIEPEASDVDITQSQVLVSIGRGVGSKDDIEAIEELAESLNADVSCSRPIVDAGWMSKSRQVGKSGLKVKPKVYLALGISGAPEHIEGMKSASTIIAVNTDPQAPIFDVAHYGIVGDLFDVTEELMDELD